MSAFEQIKAAAGFITKPETLNLLVQEKPSQRLLVRCGGGRFIVTADQCEHFMKIIRNEGSDYIRDISIPAGDSFYS